MKKLFLIFVIYSISLIAAAKHANGPILSVPFPNPGAPNPPTLNVGESLIATFAYPSGVHQIFCYDLDLQNMSGDITWSCPTGICSGNVSIFLTTKPGQIEGSLSSSSGTIIITNQHQPNPKPTQYSCVFTNLHKEG